MDVSDLVRTSELKESAWSRFGARLRETISRTTLKSILCEPLLHFLALGRTTLSLLSVGRGWLWYRVKTYRDYACGD